MRFWLVYSGKHPKVYRAETAQEAHEMGTRDGLIVTRVSRASNQTTIGALHADVTAHVPANMDGRQGFRVALQMQDMGAVADGARPHIVHWDVDRLADAVMMVYADIDGTNACQIF